MSDKGGYNWFNKNLFDIVPRSAKRILDVGCDTGLLGQELKKQDPSRIVCGIELDADAGALAKEKLDEVHILNVEQDNIGHLEGQFDAIILGDVVEHLIDPVPALKKLSALLTEEGELYTSIPNIQHYSIFRRLLKGDFQYRDSGLLDATHVRFYCLANISKLMLDAGMLPKLDSRIFQKDDQLANQLGALLGRMGLSDSELQNMETFQYQNVSCRQPRPESRNRVPVSFVVHSRYTGVLKDNFYSSPIIKSDHPHQISIYRRPMGLANAWNDGIRKARHGYVVLTREHMYLPALWDLRLADHVQEIESRFGENWVAGSSGMKLNLEGTFTPEGATLTPEQDYYPRQNTIEEVDFLDDDIIVMPVQTARLVDPIMGDHLHGIDLAIRVKSEGGHAIAIHAPCLENGPRTVQPQPGFKESVEAIKTKWPEATAFLISRGFIS